MNRAIIYFGSDLSREQFRDPEIRSEILEAGLTLVRTVPDVQVVSLLRPACAVIVELSEHATEELRQVLEKADQGKLRVDDLDRPMFRAAR